MLFFAHEPAADPPRLILSVLEAARQRAERREAAHRAGAQAAALLRRLGRDSD